MFTPLAASRSARTRARTAAFGYRGRYAAGSTLAPRTATPVGTDVSRFAWPEACPLPAQLEGAGASGARTVSVTRAVSARLEARGPRPARHRRPPRGGRSLFIPIPFARDGGAVARARRT